MYGNCVIKQLSLNEICFVSITLCCDLSLFISRFLSLSLSLSLFLLFILIKFNFNHMTQHLAVPVCSHEYAIYLFYAKRPGKVLVFFLLPIFPFNTMISMPSLLISSLTFCLIFVLITFRMNYAKEKHYFLLKVFPTVLFNMGWQR